MRCYPLALIALLAGCQSALIKPPKVVEVVVEKIVPVPAELSRDCPLTRAEERTVAAVVSAYNANVTSLESCNSDKRAIRGLVK